MKFTISCDEDPGQPGAVAADGTVERDVNMAVGNMLIAALQRCGQSVAADFSIGVVERVARANSDGSDVLVACAHNGSSDASVRGTQMVYCPGGNVEGQKVAGDTVAQAIIAAGISPRQLGDAVEQVYECCSFNKDTVYTEFLFMSNAEDLAMIHSAGYARRAAEAACQGLASHYGFAYVAPPAPPASWKTGFTAAPQHFNLAKPVPISNVVTGVVAGTINPGPLDVAGTLPGPDGGWYVTQWALDHDVPNGINQLNVAAAIATPIPPPQPPDDDSDLLRRLSALELWARTIDVRFKG